MQGGIGGMEGGIGNIGMQGGIENIREYIVIWAIIRLYSNRFTLDR